MSLFNQSIVNVYREQTTDVYTRQQWMVFLSTPSPLAFVLNDAFIFFCVLVGKRTIS